MLASCLFPATAGNDGVALEQANHGGQGMSTASSDPLIRILALPDDAFFALDDPTRIALERKVAELVRPPQLSRSPSNKRLPLPELRALNAPGQIDWRQRSVFPLLLAEVRSNQREWEVHARQNRLILVSNLSTGTVELAAPIDRRSRMPVLPASRSGPPPDDFNASLSLIGVRHHDLLKWFIRERLRGRLALTVLDFDLISNSVRVEAIDAPTSSLDSEFTGNGARHVVRTVKPSPGPPGVTLVLPPGADALAAGPLLGTIRLRNDQISSAPASPGATHALLIAASLVFVQLDNLRPLVVNLSVPADPHNNDGVEAAFSLDLRDALAGRVAAGNWLVYLVVGDTVSGPHALRLGAQ